MGFLTDFFMGTPSKQKGGPKQSDIDYATSYISTTLAGTRRDIFASFDAAQQNMVAGKQSALEILQQFLPEQLAAYTQGNQQAQATTAAGLRQQINALLGRPIDLSGLQPKAPVNADLAFLENAVLPQLAQNTAPIEGYGENTPTSDVESGIIESLPGTGGRYR